MIEENRALEIVEIPVENLEPNPWNPNRMSPVMEAKLEAYISKEGMVLPIVARRLAGSERYEILNGFHRWRLCRDRLNYKTVPCVVVEVDDKRARLLTVNLNELSGESVPTLLANLLHDLNRETTLQDLETLLPYRQAEMKDMLALLKLPDGLGARLEEEAKRQEEEALVIVSIALTREQNTLFEEALERAKSDFGEGKGWKGRALVKMVRAYLADAPEGDEKELST